MGRYNSIDFLQYMVKRFLLLPAWYSTQKARREPHIYMVLYVSPVYEKSINNFETD
jgi:hypothetical protein